jgi:glycosyltransferase involved in cell wall biosynthesis
MTSMRIAICNWSDRKVGGTETYLGNVASFLQDNGFTLALFHETDIPADRAQIALPPNVPTFCVRTMGREGALAALRAWKPDIVYTNIIEDTTIEAALLDIAPAVFDAHAFYGTCVGQSKCFKFPEVTPCTRTFGWQCLVHYYPRRCGGLSPITMVKRFRHELARNTLLPRYRAVITHSEYMRAEYMKHGVDEDRAFNVSAGLVYTPRADEANRVASESLLPDANGASTPDRALRLLFVGRMDLLKGGHVLLNALPVVQRTLMRPITMIFAGDGPAKDKWERQAARLMKERPEIHVEFAGWVSGDALSALYASADLLVVPSLWPEPFGRIGLEAGRFAVPSAAFAVGGIPDWLSDGVNGHLAPGAPPTAAGLTDAIVRCLEDPAHFAELRRGAELRSRTGGRGGAWPVICEIFERVAREA